MIDGLDEITSSHNVAVRCESNKVVFGIFVSLFPLLAVTSSK